MRRVRLLQIRALLRRQRDVHRFGRALDVGQLCRTHHRGGDLCQQPRQRDFRHGNAGAVGQLSDSRKDGRVLIPGRPVFQPCVTVLAQAFGGLPRPLGQPPAGQRAVRRHRNVLLPAERHHLPLFLPENQVVMALNGDKPGKALPLGQRIGLAELPRKAVGDSDIPRLARLHRIVQPLHNVAEGGPVIPHVIDVKVDIVRPQILQAPVEHAADVLLPADALCDLLVGAGQKLRGHHHVVPFGKIADGAAHVLLACPALVADRCIEEIDAQFQPPPDDLPGVLLVNGP